MIEMVEQEKEENQITKEWEILLIPKEWEALFWIKSCSRDNLATLRTEEINKLVEYFREKDGRKIVNGIDGKTKMGIVEILRIVNIK